ncbi:MAG TPA: zf-HC2 domain-containing protein [Planctomycetota bacterium]|nr:zf-HC2 domain-containing protein [Planctomycetota bacterium]
MWEKNPQNDVGTGCPDEASLVAYVQGELTAEEVASLEGHLAGCDDCRGRVAGFRALVGRLRELAPEPTGRDLAPLVLARLGRTVPTTVRLARIAVLAACLLLILWGGWMVTVARRTSAPDVLAAAPEEMKRALDWLAAAQENDGSWNPEKWGGQTDYRVGLTGLALLAFTGAGETPTAGPHADTVARAAAYLVGEQSKTGRFGPFFSGAPYNHGIATVALLETYARTNDVKLRAPLARAVHFIKSRQDTHGGWGYLAPDVHTNTSITAWQLHALLLADALGWSDRNATARRGLTWLAGVVDDEGRAGYSRSGDFPYGSRTLTAMTAFCLSVGARREAGRDTSPLSVVDSLARLAAESTREADYYEWYFLAHALSAARGKPSDERSEFDPLMAQLRTALIERQVKTGANAGSWDPSDRWGRAGGRVYATAMAALSLQADTRAAGLLEGTKASAR